MTIPTQMSLHGFIATAPELSFTNNGHARFFARIGVEQFRKEVDGSFTKLEATFHDLVMFERNAERAYPRFKVGDQFVASATSTSTRPTRVVAAISERSSSRVGSVTTAPELPTASSGRRPRSSPHPPHRCR